MLRRFALAALTLSLCTAATYAGENAPKIVAGGLYVEARNCDVWTGPCFANADFNLSGKNALLAWKIDKGSLAGVSLDGLSVVAVVAANNTIGLEQSGPAQAVVIVDSRA